MTLKKGILYVFIANFINLVVSFFTGFILPKYLSINTYSSIKLFQLYITYIGILHLGFSDGMYLRIGGEKINELDKKFLFKEFSTFVIFQSIIQIVLIIISIFLKNIIIFFCSLVIIPIQISNYIRNLYQASGQFKEYSRFTNINTILIFIINVSLLFLIKTDNSIFYLIGYVISYYIYLFFIFINLFNKIGINKLCFSLKVFKDNIKSGFFLMIGNFCNVIFTGIDRLFVQNLLGVVEFAYYSFAVSIEGLLNTFINPVTTVMYNYFCNNSSSTNVKKIKNIVLIFGGILISSAFLIKILVELFLGKYIASLSVLYILFAAQYFSFIIKCVHLNLFKAKKLQNIYFGLMVIIIILSIILNLIFFNIENSIVYIAYATLVVNFIWFLVGELYFKDYWLNYKEYFYVAIILISFMLLNTFMSNNYGAFIIYIVIYLIFTVILNNETFTYLVKELTKFLKKKHKNAFASEIEKSPLTNKKI